MSIKKTSTWGSIVLIIMCVIIIAFVYTFNAPSQIKPNPFTGASSTPVTDGQDRISVTYPIKGTQINSPLIVKGYARGTWYFEASFPAILIDWDGKIIAQVPAHAKGDWMTSQYVPFEATLNFIKPECKAEFCKRGTLILRRDNPSGIAANDAALEIPIYFK